MTKDEIIERLNEIQNFENPLTLTFFGFVNGEIRKADISNRFEPLLGEEIKGKITELLDKIRLEEFSVKDIVDVDERKNVAYVYNLEEQIDAHVYFKAIDNGAIEYFSRSRDDINDINAIVYRYGSADDNVLIYRHFYAINWFKNSRRLLVFENDQRLDLMEKDQLQLDTQIDYIRLKKDDDIIIFNLSVLEKFGGYEDAIRKKATANISTIAHLDIVDNLEYIGERVTKLGFARKMAKLNTNAVVMGMDKQAIKSFITSHPTLNNVLKFEKNDKIKLKNTKQFDTLLKLFNDEFLHSGLTNIDYWSLAKDKL